MPEHLAFDAREGQDGEVYDEDDEDAEYSRSADALARDEDLVVQLTLGHTGSA